MKVSTKEIIKYYGDGRSIESITSITGLTRKAVINKIKKYRSVHEKSNKSKKSYGEDLKKIIALRDKNDVPRSQISKELGVSNTFISESCKKYGDELKRKALFPNQYSYIGDFDFSACPECESKRLNVIDEFIDWGTVDARYCMNCGNEFFKFMNDDKKTYKLNFEFDEE